MSGSTDHQVLEAAQILCMLATGDRQTSQHPSDHRSRALVWRPPLTRQTYESLTPVQSSMPVIQDSITVVQIPPPSVQSPAPVQSTSPAEQSPPAEADTNSEREIYTMRSILLQALLTAPEGDWMRLRDVHEYLCNTYPRLDVLHARSHTRLMSHFDLTLKRAMNVGLVEKWKRPGDRTFWRIKAGERRRAIYIAWEKRPRGVIHFGRPYSLPRGSGRARNDQNHSKVPSPKPATPEPTPEPASHEPTSPEAASPAPARAVPDAVESSRETSSRARRKAVAGRQLRSRFLPE